MTGGPLKFLALQQHLHGAGSIPALFGLASEVARIECGFSRAVLLAIEDGQLTATLMPALQDDASDRLRRQLLAEPVRLTPESLEAGYIRLAEGARGEVIEGESVLKEQYGLEHFAIGAVMPSTRVLCLLVVDRPRQPVGFTDRVVVQAFAQHIACSLERLVLHRRLGEFSSELRYMMTSADALLHEGLASDITLPVDRGAGLVFPHAGELKPMITAQGSQIFTRREMTVVELLMAGRSNREIAETLHLSPDTVKKHISRIMRKTGAANRAEAAVQCVRLLQSAPAGDWPDRA